jgi:mono/diheme cytochrome c family protein
MFIAPRVALIIGVAGIIGIAAVPSGAGEPQSAPQQQATAYHGQPLFKTYCVTCHGPSGQGDGPFAKSLRRRPPDLTQLAKVNEGTFPADRVAKAIDGRDAKSHGSSEMPVWGDAFSRTTHDNDADAVRRKIESLVKFIETLQERPAVP